MHCKRTRIMVLTQQWTETKSQMRSFRERLLPMLEDSENLPQLVNRKETKTAKLAAGKADKKEKGEKMSSPKKSKNEEKDARDSFKELYEIKVCPWFKIGLLQYFVQKFEWRFEQDFLHLLSFECVCAF